MGVLNQIGQLLFSLSFLIVLHELGHFVPAKLFKTRVEKFYLFFNPYFSLFKKKIGETTYGIGWLPLGGYVKIAGMIDESMDKEQMKKDPEPWEFRSKPAWQRLIIMLGGVTVNAILAVLIYIMVMFVWGQTIIPSKALKDGIWVANDEIAQQIGIHTGDKIIAIDGENCEDRDISKVLNDVTFSKSLTIERDGKQFEHEFPSNFIKLIGENQGEGMKVFQIRWPFVVGDITEKSNAEKAGLKKDDIIQSVDSMPVKYLDQFVDKLAGKKGKEVELVVLRGEELVTLNASVDENGKIGFQPLRISLEEIKKEKLYDIQVIHYSFLQAIPAGINETGYRLGLYTKNFLKIFDFKSEAYKYVGGFKAFGSMFPEEWSWEATWRNTAFISIILAFMNLLPIPALDGGHAMFLSYELITGRKPHEKLMEYAQMAGMILLLSVVIIANINDWI